MNQLNFTNSLKEPIDFDDVKACEAFIKTLHEQSKISASYFSDCSDDQIKEMISNGYRDDYSEIVNTKILHGKQEIANMLIDHGFLTDNKTAGYAAEAGFLDIVEKSLIIGNRIERANPSNSENFIKILDFQINLGMPIALEKIFPNCNDTAALMRVVDYEETMKRTEKFDTYLKLAIQGKNYNAIDALIFKGMNPALIKPFDLLDYLANSKEEEFNTILHKIHEHGLYKRNMHYGHTLIDVLIDNTYDQLVPSIEKNLRKAVEMGVNINSVHRGRGSPLDRLAAAKWASADLMEFFVRNGAMIGVRLKDSCSLFACLGNEEIGTQKCDRLIRLAAELEPRALLTTEKNGLGLAQMICIGRGGKKSNSDLQLLQALAEVGYNFSIRDATGHTPMDVAQKYGNEEAVGIMLSLQAKQKVQSVMAEVMSGHVNSARPR